MSAGPLVAVSAFASALLLPWPVTALLAVLASVWEPLVPFGVGLVVDALYGTPAEGLPYFTLLGFACSLGAYLVRRSIQASIMRE